MPGARSGRVDSSPSDPFRPVNLPSDPTQENDLLPASNGPQRIVLTGFMGAGKTTVGRLLAGRLKWRFQDVDDAIVAAAGASIPEIFAQHGESWFRELEHQTVRQFLGSSQLVLALGGGAIEDQRTRSLLLRSPFTHLIHLEVTLKTVLERCHGTESARPVLNDRRNLEARYLSRLPLYRESHCSLPADSLLPEEIVDALLLQIRS